eukprot:gb/GECG01013142.1/.p1 GENE.gb/GECG01013142.1/~~gb/GECG01013142.1/.p1  ORF type:complete len:1563 (+),score=222.42 gb/GECG01013142.1/:1-4689(+)
MASSGDTRVSPGTPDGGKLALHCLTPAEGGNEGEMKWRAFALKDPSRVPVQLCSMEDYVLLRDAQGKVIKIQGGKWTVLNFKSPVVDIAAGPRHALFLMKHGEVFCYGDNSYGQCGRDPFERNVEIPQPPTQVSLKHRVKRIAAGVDKSAALLSNGSVVVWGGQSVDLYLVEDSIVTYESEDFDGEQIKQISLGLNHLAFVDYSGQLWHAGDFGVIGSRAGVGRYPHPVIVEGNVGGLMVRKAVCGPDFTIVLTEGGKLFRYGRIPTDFSKLSGSYFTRITDDASVENEKAVVVVIPHYEAVEVHKFNEKSPGMKWEDVHVCNIAREPFLDFASKRSKLFSNVDSDYPGVSQHLRKLSSLGFAASSESSVVSWIRNAPFGSVLGVNSLRHVFSLDEDVFDRPLGDGSVLTLDGVLKSYFVSHIAQTASSIYFVGSFTHSSYRQLAPLKQPASVEALSQISQKVFTAVLGSMESELSRKGQQRVHAGNGDFQLPQKKSLRATNRTPENTSDAVEETQNPFALLEDEEAEEGSSVDVDNVTGEVHEAFPGDVESVETSGDEERSVVGDILSTHSSVLFAALAASVETVKRAEALPSKSLGNTLKSNRLAMMEYLEEQHNIGKTLSRAVRDRALEDLMSLAREGQTCKRIQQQLHNAQFCKEDKSSFLVMWEAFILRHSSDCLAAFAVFQNTVCVICEWLEYLQRKWDQVNTLPSGEQPTLTAPQTHTLQQQRQQLSTRKKGVGRKDREESQRQRGCRRFGHGVPTSQSTTHRVEEHDDHPVEEHIPGIGYSGVKGDEIGGGGYVLPESDYSSPAGHEAKLANQAASAQSAAYRLLGASSGTEHHTPSPIQGTAKRLLTVIGRNPREVHDKHRGSDSEDDEHSFDIEEEASSSGSSNVNVSKHSVQRRVNKAQYSSYSQLSSSKSSGDLRSQYRDAHNIYTTGTVDDTHQPTKSYGEEATRLPSSTAIRVATEQVSRSLRDNRFHDSGSATSVDSQSAIKQMRDGLKTLDFFQSCNEHVLLCIASILMWAASSTWNLPVTRIDPIELRNSLSLNYDIWSDMLSFLKAFKPCFIWDTVEEHDIPASHTELVYKFYRLPDYVKVPLFSLNKKEADLQHSHISESENEDSWQSFVVEPLRRITHGIFCPLTVQEVYDKGLKLRELRTEESPIKERLGKLAEAVVSDTDLYCSSCLLEGRNWWESYMENSDPYFSHFDFNHLSKCVQSDYSGAHTGCNSTASVGSVDGVTEGSDVAEDDYKDQSRGERDASAEAVVAADSSLSLEEARARESEKNRIAKQKKNVRKAEQRKRNAMKRKVTSEYTSMQDKAQRERVETLKTVLDTVKGDSLLQTRSGQLLPVHGEVMKRRIPRITSAVGSQLDIQWHRFPWLDPCSTEILSFPWELRDVPDSLLPELLAYAYRGQPIIRTTTALPLLVASAALELYDLRRAVEQFLLTNRFASAETVSQMIELSLQTKAYGLFSFARTLAILDGVAIDHALQLERVPDRRGGQEPAYQTPRRSRTYSVGEVAASRRDSPWEKDKLADSSHQTLASRLRSDAKSQTVSGKQ